MESVEQYRQYAEECRRLAGRAAPKEKVALLEIAAAWDECAKSHRRDGKEDNRRYGRQSAGAKWVMLPLEQSAA
jgi:hypothetical protein